MVGLGDVPVGNSPLVGRQGQLDELAAAVRGLVAGQGGCLLVEGPAGIGKSRLLAETVELAGKHGLVVASGRSMPFDRVAPLTALLGPLRTAEPPVLDGDAVAEFAGAGRQGEDGSRYWMVDRLGARLEDYVRRQPLVIALDDAHWADELSALALRMLVPTTRTSPVLWLIARRPQPADTAMQAALDQLVDEGSARPVSLAPLEEGAVAQLCHAILSAAPGHAVLDLAVRAGGNPFLLEELLTTLHEEGRIEIVDGVATVCPGDLPESFRAAVDRRLQGLSAQARQLLEVGAVFGRPFTVHEAAPVAGRSAVELLDAARETVKASFLTDHAEQLAFRHDLIRESVYLGLPGPVRRALHREAAAAVRAEGRPVVESAEHLARGANRRDTEAIQILREAATEVAPNAPAAAADLLLRAARLLDDDDGDRPGIIADIVWLLAAAGRVDQAVRLGEQALGTRQPPCTEIAILLGLAEALKHAGRDDAVLAYARRGLSLNGVPDQARAQLLATQAHGLLQANDLAGADEAGAEAACVGAASEQHSAVVYGLAARSVSAVARGELETAARIATDAVRLADEAGGDAAHRHPRVWLAAALLAADRLVEAEAVCELGQRAADRLGTAWSQPLWHHLRAQLQLATGRLDDAATEAEAGLRVAEQLNALAMAGPLLAVLAQVAVRRDELDLARQQLTTAARLLDSGVGIGVDHVTWTLGYVEEALGGTPADLPELYEALPGRLMLLTQEPLAGPHLVARAIRADVRDQAVAVADAMHLLADRNPAVASLAGAAAHTRGLVDGDLDLLRHAVRCYQSSPRPILRAAGLADLADAELRAGDRAAAVRRWEQAMALYTACGAKRDATRTRRAMRAAGAGGRRDRSAARPPTGWASLTASELRVVRLVAEGLTNREAAARLFLSPHTVDTHLRHAFTKLNVTSRVELTRLVIANDQQS